VFMKKFVPICTLAFGGFKVLKHCFSIIFYIYSYAPSLLREVNPQVSSTNVNGINRRNIDAEPERPRNCEL